jgi:predicted transcriptional regulator
VTTSNPIDLAAEIVTSFVAKNSVPRGELPALIEAVHAAVKRLADGGEVAPAPIDPPTPAVSIRKSVTPDYLICLEDGLKFKSLRRHLTSLGMTPEQYRQKWNLPSDYPMVPSNYAAQRSALAKNSGFWLREKPIAATPPSPSPVEIEAATVPPVSADPIDAAAHNAAGVTASRAKTKGKVAVPPAKRKSGRARKATA